MFTIVALSVIGLLLWAALKSLGRLVARLLAVIAIASATALVFGVVLGQSTEGQIGWGLTAFFVTTILAARWISPRDRSPRERWSSAPETPGGHSPFGGAGFSRQAATGRPDEPRELRVRALDRFGLSKAARDRRSAAKLAAEGAAAWARLSAEAEFAINRICLARRSCERFVRQTRSIPFHTEAMAHLIVVDKRVPEMIRRRLELCAEESPIERRRLLNDLVDRLEQIAAEGERRLSRSSPGELQELETERVYLEAHFATRAANP